MRRTLVLLPLLLVGLPSCGSGESGGESVETAAEAPARPADLPGHRRVPGAPPDSVVVAGSVEPGRFADVRFEVPGTVAEIFVQEGETVRKGQALARLDTTERDERLVETRRRLRDARAAAPGGETHRSGAKPPAYLAREMRARRADADRRAALAGRDRRRFERASADGGEDAASDEVARIARQRNRSGGRSSAVTTRAAEGRLSAALVDDLEQRERQLEFALSQSTLRSPVGGEVVAINAREGGAWNTRDAEPTFSILDPDSMVVRAAVPSRLARVLEVGEPVWVEVPGSGATLDAEALNIPVDDLRVADAEGEFIDVREVLFRFSAAGAPEMGTEVRVAIRP